jgi:L-fuculose-phosphate aldolase
MGLNSSISGNQSIRIDKEYIWITPSGIPRYNLTQHDMVKVNLLDGSFSGQLRPSVEWKLHTTIYKRMININSVLHTHSPYSLSIAISSEFQPVLEEAELVLGGPPSIIPNKPSGSEELVNEVLNVIINNDTKIVVILNHGIFSIGETLEDARINIESLEEWSKILAISKLFGGPKYFLK